MQAQPGHEKAIQETYAELCKWADINDVKYAVLQARMEASQGRHAAALRYVSGTGTDLQQHLSLAWCPCSNYAKEMHATRAIGRAMCLPLPWISADVLQSCTSRLANFLACKAVVAP